MKIFQPANTSEGDAFLSAWCSRCARDRSYREDPEDDGCSVLSAAMVFSPGEKEYQAEWIYDGSGRPCCLAFEVDAERPANSDMLRIEAAGQLRLFAR